MTIRTDPHRSAMGIFLLPIVNPPSTFCLKMSYVRSRFFTDLPYVMKSLITLFLLLISVPAFAQITLTSDQFLQIGTAPSDSYTNSTKSPQSLINMTGADQSWDFSGLGFTVKTAGSAAHIAVYPAGAANASSFPTATHVSIDTVRPGYISYSFLQINSTGIYSLGTSQDSLGSKRVSST